MKKSVLRGFNLILSSILAMLGFGSCDDVINGNMVCEYGVPTANYILKAKVTNLNSEAVKGERIIVKTLDSNGKLQHPYDNDTIYTDANGEIQQKARNNLYFPKKKFRFVAEDPMGIYEKDSVDVEPKQTGKGDGNWYHGIFEVSADIKLQGK